ncbi:MAG: alpha-1,2-fucosyltransferase [Flavobacteriales bacterium]|nr:alpha-1,2-fucosyltransferase [Flavobacteriales bacterium]
MNYVAVRLAGGLGNQMFEYAAGRAAADALNCPLYLDHSLLEKRFEGMNYTPRDFALDVFHIRAERIPDAILREIVKSERPLSRLLRRIAPEAGRIRHVHDTSQTFDRWSSFSGPLYLTGYWQSEKYFSGIRNALCEKDFQPIETAPDAVSRMRDRILASPCISIHVRRGDYVTNSNAAAYHGVCDVDYYREACRWLAEATGIKRYAVFSDDLDWVKSHLALQGEMVYVELPADIGAHWELGLMQQCHHHIIANSSFSWWGAWLNQRIDKKVVAPARWFVNQVSDIVPPSWIKC